MTLRDFIEACRSNLSEIYDQREAANIVQLLVEDTLDLKKQQITNTLKDEVDESLFTEFLIRLKKGEPIQYVLGMADFYGLRLCVNQHVLIPRPETEELVDLIVKDVQTVKSAPGILDIGTGSGCIAITLKKALPQATLTALDENENTLNVAKRNARLNDVEIEFLLLNFLNIENHYKLKNFDIIISNPPYITMEEFEKLSPLVKNHEPKQALVANHDDPFIFYRIISDFGKEHLAINGTIYLEMNSLQVDAIVDIYNKNGYGQVQLIEDLQGMKRMLKIKK